MTTPATLRRATRLAAGVTLVLAAMTATTATSGAGNANPGLTLTINKAVTGQVPAGTTFTVHVNCAGAAEVAPAVGTVIDVTYDATGAATPPGSNLIHVPTPGGECDIGETVNGGALSTTYACTISGPQGPGQNSCIMGGAFPVTVTWQGTQTATVTVTNAFPDPAQAVAAEADFTG